ncbi:MAG TPA: OmpA family protein [Candidatus Krumholzibacteria bacterium]|nr:OmpA family protein [Candidatus Krumholzibacteria bacterium]
MTVFFDANGNGRADPGEQSPGFLSLAAGAATPVDVAVVLPALANGTALVEVRATSTRDPGARAPVTAAFVPASGTSVIRITSLTNPPAIYFGPIGNPAAPEGSPDDETRIAIGVFDRNVVFSADIENACDADSVEVWLSDPPVLPAGAQIVCSDTSGTPYPISTRNGHFVVGAFASGEVRPVRIHIDSPGAPLRVVLGATPVLRFTARSRVDSTVMNSTVLRLVPPATPDPRTIIGLDQTFREATASLGDVVTLVVTVTNRTDSVRVANLRVFESLPPALDFRGGKGVTMAGGQMVWDVGTLDAGETRQTALKFAVNSRESKGWARASATATGDADTGDRVQAGPVVAAVRIDNEESGIEGFVLGDVWVDADEDGVRDAGERGIPNASLYLESGEHVVTDSLGVFSIPHVFEGRRMVRLDERSLPADVTFAEPLAGDVDAPRGNERLVHLLAPGHVRVAFPLREVPPPPIVRSVLMSFAEKVSVAHRAWLYDKLTFSSAEFAFGKATLVSGAGNALIPAANFLNENPGWMVLVEGHTDNVPIHTREFPSNLQLSEARAGAVRDALAAMGVAPGRIVVVGYGDTRPVAGNTTVEGRRLNRRVEVSFIPPSAAHLDHERRVAAAVRDLSTVPDSVRATVFWSFSTTAEKPQRGSLRIDVPRVFTDARVTATLAGDSLVSQGGAFVFDSFLRGRTIECRVTFTAAAVDTPTIHDIAATVALADSSAGDEPIVASPGAASPVVRTDVREAVIHPLDNPASARRTVTADAIGWTELIAAPRAPAAPRPPAVADEAAAPGPVMILDPAEGSVVSNRDQVSISVRHPLGSRPVLRVNEDLVGDQHIGQRNIDVARDTETTTWFGVRLRPGWNKIVARAALLRGGTEGDSVRVALASRPSEFVALDARTVIPADGRTPATIRFAVRDAFGLPVMDGLVVTVSEGAEYVALPDARPGERGLQATTSEGMVSLVVRPRHDTGTVRVGIDGGGMSAGTEVVFVAPERPLLATGVVDIAMGAYQTDGSGSGHGVENYRDGFDVAGESRLFVQGAAPGGFSVTARLDTRKRYDDPLLKQPDPEKQYPVYGDASELRYAAPARGGNYFSLDRGQSYLRYGDLKTPIDHGEFLTYHQTVTGLSSALVDGGNSVRAFVTETDFVTRTDDIPADGTSGFYHLLAAPIVENSERIVIETRDRFQSEKVIEARVMIRRRDYTINPYDGSILFMEPVPMTDRELNPNHVVVTYQTESAGANMFQFGLRADAINGQRYRAGLTAVANSGDGPAYALYGVDGETRVHGVRFGGEVARSNDDTMGDGNAYKIAAAAAGRLSKLDLYLRKVDGNFSNPSFRGADSELASVKAGFAGRLGLSGSTFLNADGYTHELQRTDERHETARTTLDYRRRLLEMSAGLRYARHAQPVGGPAGTTGADGDARGVLALAGVTVGNRGTLGVSTSLEQHVAGDVVDDYPNRLKTVLAVPLAERFRAIATHEYLTASGRPATHQITAGVEGNTAGGLQAYSRYSMDRVGSDDRMGAVSGIRQKLPLNRHTALTLGVEGFVSLADRADDEYVSVTSGLGSRKPGDYFVDGGFEYRWESLGEKNLLRLSAAKQLDGGFALLTKNILGLGMYDAGNDETQYYATLAGSYRSPHAPVQSLAMLKSYYDRYTPFDPESIRWRLVASIDVNVLPNPEHELRFKYAFKHVEDWSYSVSQTTNTDLVLGQYVWRFARGWDLDTWGRITATRAGGSAGYGAGVEVGRLFFRSVRIGAGYSLNGFEDADVLGSDAWSRGFGVRIQMLLSDWLLADFERLRQAP